MKKNISRYFFLISAVVLVSVISMIVVLLKSNDKSNVFAPGIHVLDHTSNKTSFSYYMKANITINGFNLTADVPITTDEFQKGLDIKDHIDENQGMLFIFKEPDKTPFWMHGMKFPIDIIWFDSNGNVIHIEHNLQPCITDLVCPLYSPEKNALYVLETKAGFSEIHNVKVGTLMNFHIINK